MDEGLSHAVREVFVQLHEKGLIYRGKRLVNWDPVLHTALSDLEVVSQEEDGHLWHLRYPAGRRQRRIWSWPPRGPRRCWVIPPWPCIPRTSATGI